MGSASSVASAPLADVRAMINATTGRASYLTGAGVGIALIDTGVAPAAGLPAAQIVNGPDLSFESQSGDLRYLDTYGHGTHLAGIIVGDGTGGGSVGVAPRAKLTSIKVGSASGAVDVTQVIAAIDWVVQHRYDDWWNPIRVINLAYGSGAVPSIYTDPVMAAVEQAWKAGIVVVCAAGNDGGVKMVNPAFDPFVIAAGSASTKGTISTADDEMSTFTNGSRATTMRPTVLAPGEGIVSARNPGSNVDKKYPAARTGTNQFRGSGTSQASAVVSAAVALLLQARPWLSPDEVRQLLKSSGTAVGDSQMVNVNAAIGAAVPAFTPRTIWSSGDGLLESARGTAHVAAGDVKLTGENSIFGPFDTAAWVARSKTHSAWVGGVWMGKRFAGDGWTGTSWASRTWGSATWSGVSWAGLSWTDPGWQGRYWNGRYWNGGDWEGRYWSTDDWSAALWG